LHLRGLLLMGGEGRGREKEERDGKERGEGRRREPKAGEGLAYSRRLGPCKT